MQEVIKHNGDGHMLATPTAELSIHTTEICSIAKMLPIVTRYNVPPPATAVNTRLPKSNELGELYEVHYALCLCMYLQIWKTSWTC